MKRQGLSYVAILIGLMTVGDLPTPVGQPSESMSAEAALQIESRYSVQTEFLSAYERTASENDEIGSSITLPASTSIAAIQAVILPSFVFLLVLVGVTVKFIVLPGIVRIDQHEVGLVRKKFGRSTRNLIALYSSESGWQAETLNPGIHWRFLWLYEVVKEEAIRIDSNKIGLVEAKDGASLQGSENFGKFIAECDNFQKAKDFFDKGGQRGKQLAVLNSGTYRINTKLFTVKIRDMTCIDTGHVGIVEAMDGSSLEPGKNFGKSVDSDDFQDAQKFVSHGGQRGYQISILNPGTYQINTDFFRVKPQPLIHIETDEIGLVEARDGRSLPHGRNFAAFVECNSFQDAEAFLREGGQRGKQLSVLKAGIYQINTALFNIRKTPIVRIPSGEIGLIIAQDGAPLTDGRILARAVDCNEFQDAQAFISNGGQRGKQLSILRSGEYQINTDLFTVVTTANASAHGVDPADLKVYKVEEGNLGIITTLDGASLPNGEIAGPIIEGHRNFQNGQRFIDAGGYRGLQEEFLQAGSWSLNPWFVQVLQIPMTEIYPDEVGVIVSYVGQNSDRASRKVSRLVDEGFKGIQNEPLPPGRYSINTKVKSVEIVPTNAIVLEWSDDDKPSDNYDASLTTLELRTQESFSFRIAVTQVIGINAEDAPKMILRVGSHVSEATENRPSSRRKNNAIKSLVMKILGPMIDNYFQNSAQDFEALDFLENRAQIQAAAAEHIKIALNETGVQALGTFINITDFPPQLEEQLKRRKISEQERQTIETEELTEKLRSKLARQKEETKAQAEKLKAERELELSKLDAQKTIQKSQAEAESQRLKDDVDLQTEKQRLEMATQDEEKRKNIEINELKERIMTLSPDLYARIESEKAWSQALMQMKIDMPEVYVGGSNSNASGTDALQAGAMQFAWMDMLRETLTKRGGKSINTARVDVLNPSVEDDYPTE
ncbi:MAG: SPFH domain-containing protein [Phormidesmis sp.]